MVYIKVVIEKQKSVFCKTEVNIEKAQEKQKQQCTTRKGITEYNFKIGDNVLQQNM